MDKLKPMYISKYYGVWQTISRYTSQLWLGRGQVTHMTDLQMAIKWLEFMQESGYETEAEQQHCRILLDALRKEPCEICGNFKRIECKADNLEFIAVRCPNCGRKLVKHDG